MADAPVEHIKVGRYCFPLYSHPNFRGRVQDDNYVQAAVAALLQDPNLYSMLDAAANALFHQGKTSVNEEDVEELLRCLAAETERGERVNMEQGGDEANCNPLQGNTAGNQNPQQQQQQQQRPSHFTGSSSDRYSSRIETVFSPKLTTRTHTPGGAARPFSGTLTSDSTHHHVHHQLTATQPGVSHSHHAEVNEESEWRRAQDMQREKKKKFAQRDRWNPTEERHFRQRQQQPETFGSSAMPQAPPRLAPLSPSGGGASPATAVVPAHNSRVMAGLEPAVFSTATVTDMMYMTEYPLQVPPVQHNQQQHQYGGIRYSEYDFGQMPLGICAGWDCNTEDRSRTHTPMVLAPDECPDVVLAAKHTEVRGIIRTAMYSLLSNRVAASSTAASRISPAAINKARKQQHAVDAEQLYTIPKETYAAMDVLLDGNSSCISRRVRTDKLSAVQKSALLFAQKEQERQAAAGGGPMTRTFPNANPTQDYRTRRIANARLHKRQQQERYAPTTSGDASAMLTSASFTSPVFDSGSHRGTERWGSAMVTSVPGGAVMRKSVIPLPEGPWSPLSEDAAQLPAWMRTRKSFDGRVGVNVGSGLSRSQQANMEKALAAVKNSPL